MVLLDLFSILLLDWHMAQLEYNQLVFVWARYALAWDVNRSCFYWINVLFTFLFKSQIERSHLNISFEAIYCGFFWSVTVAVVSGFYLFLILDFYWISN